VDGDGGDSSGTVQSYDALGFDPAPGDLAEIAELARRYQESSEQLADAHARSDPAQRNSVYFAKAARSLAAAAQALQDWHEELGALKQQARVLEIRARRAEDADPLRQQAEVLRDKHAELAKVMTERVDAARAQAPAEPGGG
jgi:DNA repair exonuclease SbcCD ATPase subunit